MPDTNYSSVVRMTWEGTVYSQQVVNVHYFQLYNNLVPTAPDKAVMDSFLAYIDSAVKTRYLAMLSNKYSLVKLTCRTILDPQIVTEFDYAAPQPVGAVESESGATQVAGIISWKTPYAGRRYRGRTYVPAIAETMISLGFLEQAQRDAMSAYAEFFRAMAWIGPASASWSANMVILSDPDGVLPTQPTPAGKRTPTFDIVQSHIERFAPGTQRRRRIGVGS